MGPKCTDWSWTALSSEPQVRHGPMWGGALGEGVDDSDQEDEEDTVVYALHSCTWSKCELDGEINLKLEALSARRDALYIWAFMYGLEWPTYNLFDSWRSIFSYWKSVQKVAHVQCGSSKGCWSCIIHDDIMEMVREKKSGSRGLSSQPKHFKKKWRVQAWLGQESTGSNKKKCQTPTPDLWLSVVSLKIVPLYHHREV